MCEEAGKTEIRKLAKRTIMGHIEAVAIDGDEPDTIFRDLLTHVARVDSWEEIETIALALLLSCLLENVTPLLQALKKKKVKDTGTEATHLLEKLGAARPNTDAQKKETRLKG
jgi:hypothetical protein